MMKRRKLSLRRLSPAGQLGFAAVLGTGLLCGLPQSSWAQRQSDQPAEQQRQQSDDNRRASSTRGDDASLLRGEIVTARDGRLTLTVPGGERRTLQVAEDAQITVNGRTAKLSDLQEGQQVQIRTSDEEPQRVISVEVSRRGQSANQRRPGEDRDASQDQRTIEDRESARQRPRQDQRQPLGPEGRQRAETRDDQPGGLGVVLETRAPGPGVVISQVHSDSPATQAGLRPGDRILAVDDQEISSPGELIRAITRHDPGTVAQLTVERNGEERQMEVQLSTRSDALGDQGRRGQNVNRSGGQDRPWLGIRLDQDAEQAPRVASVYPSGPAARAGLRSGDVIVSLEGEQVGSNDELIDILEHSQPGRSVEIVVQRDGQERRIIADVARRSDFFQQPFDGTQSYARRGQGRRLNGQTRFYGGESQGGTYPEHSMMLEQHRRIAEQHERIESLVLDLREEVSMLRQELQAGRRGNQQSSERVGATQSRRDSGQPAPPRPATPQDRDNQPRRDVDR